MAQYGENKLLINWTLTRQVWPNKVNKLRAFLEQFEEQTRKTSTPTATHLRRDMKYPSEETKEKLSKIRSNIQFEEDPMEIENGLRGIF